MTMPVFKRESDILIKGISLLMDEDAFDFIGDMKSCDENDAGDLMIQFLANHVLKLSSTFHQI